MFKNREMRVRFVKNKKADQDNLYDCVEEGDFPGTPEEISEIAKDFVKYTSIAVVSVMAVATILHTLSEIAINATAPKKE